MLRSMMMANVFFFACAFAPALQTSGSSVEEARRQIEELHTRDAVASEAGDVAALASLWTRDGVALPPDHQPVIGGAWKLPCSLGA